jgi:hypothetical protein
LMQIRIRILPLTFLQIYTLQWSKMTLSGFHLSALMRIRNTGWKQGGYSVNVKSRLDN